MSLVIVRFLRCVANTLDHCLRNLLLRFIENIRLLGGGPILREIDPLQNHAESAEIAGSTLVGELSEHLRSC